MSDTDQSPVTIEELHAFADGQLPADRSAVVAAYIQDHPDAAARVRDYRLLNAALIQAVHGSAGTVLANDPPPAHRHPPLFRRPPLWRVAAMVALVALGAAGGWTGRTWLDEGQQTQGDLAQRAGAAYRVYAADAQHPVEETEAGRLAAWLSGRMNMPIRIPDLGDAGFSLVGGRLMIGERAPAGLLMYQDGQGRRLVLYLRNDLPSAAASHMRYHREATEGVITWRDAVTGFGLAGGLSEQELRPVADRIRAQFSL